MSAEEFRPNNAATGHKVAAFLRAGDGDRPGSCQAAYDPVTKTLRVRRHDGREEILEDLTPSDIDDIEEIMAGGSPPALPEEESTSQVFAGTRREHYGLTALLYLLIEAQGTAKLEELVSMIERRRDQHMSLVSNPEERATRYYRFNDEDLGRVAEKFAARLLAAKLPEAETASKTPPPAPDQCTSCLCGAEFGAAHESDCPAAPRMGEASEHYSPPSEVAP
jgi:hypothetical protein